MGSVRGVDRYSIEFEAEVVGNTIALPTQCRFLEEVRVRVIVHVPTQVEDGSFNPKDYFGLGKLTRQACDGFLAKGRDGWARLKT